ncbi:hypothetical protein BC833DRAFT_592711 [Globomyces pollinis-pini]|nr:hypothetical protein BC833DRAFT_592711 [Globomyces pollinis-pini]
MFSRIESGIKLDCKIENNRTTFVQSQKIQGDAIFHLEQQSKVKFFKIEFIGRIDTYLQTGILIGNQTFAKLFHDTNHLIGNGSFAEKDHYILQGGTYSFPFEFTMPNQSLPASFTGEFGKVEYKLLLTLLTVKDSKFSKEIIITVPSTRDATDIDLLQPVSIAKQGYSELWGARNPYDVIVSVPKKGYESEEIIPVTVKIRNYTKRELQILSVCLKEVVSYTGIDSVKRTKTTKTVTNCVHSLSYSENFDADLENIQRFIQFPIPPTILMNPDVDTNLITVHHEIEICFKSIVRFSSVVTIQLPIVIAGFPSMLFEDSWMRRSIDTLPEYYTSLTDTSNLHPLSSPISQSTLTNLDYFVDQKDTLNSNDIYNEQLSFICRSLANVAISEAMDEIYQESGPSVSIPNNGCEMKSLDSRIKTQSMATILVPVIMFENEGKAPMTLYLS